MKRVIATNTHYIIEDYNLGDCPKLEKYASVYNEMNHCYEPLYIYNQEDRTLRLPRGIYPYILENNLGAYIDYDRVIGGRSVRIGMKLAPRNLQQKSAIRFLIGKGEYDYTNNSSQLVLSLPSGGGKTFCAVSAMSLFGLATIVITHNDDIKKQWKDRLLEYTDIPEKSIVLLNSSSQMNMYLTKKRGVMKQISGENVYILTHSMLRSYIKTYGGDSLQELMVKLGIGIKIVDECHKEFYNTMEIDNIVSVYKNFYLTATFGRTDAIENTVYQRMFQGIYKLVVPEDEMGVTKNVLYVTNLINSRPSKIDMGGMFTYLNRGNKMAKFNVIKYMEYAINKGVVTESVKMWLNKLSGLDGLILIISPKISINEYFCQIAQEMFPEKKCAVHGSTSKVDNIEDYDIICATSKIIGTGNDIDKLKAIIIVEPIGSEKNAYQIFHRLMRGNDTDKRWYIEIIDKGVPNFYNMYRRNRKKLEESALEHYVFDETARHKYK